VEAGYGKPFGEVRSDNGVIAGVELVEDVMKDNGWMRDG
jgi:hypothetical protein